MAFRRKLAAEPAIVENALGGEGHLEKRVILEAGEMSGKGRLFARNVLQKGCSIGRHRHNGDSETYVILSGKGKYLLNGELVDVEAGDVLYTADGEEHQLINECDEPLEFIALVLYS